MFLAPVGVAGTAVSFAAAFYFFRRHWLRMASDICLFILFALMLIDAVFLWRIL